ncbi:MAG TPA: SAF domain-containing protein [Ilumatobacteraceae bacterium]
MGITVRIRQELARRPWLHWLVIGMFAMTAAGAARAVAERADAERRRWGELIEVFVATGDVAPGDLVAASVDRRQLPAALVPADAVVAIDAGHLARQHISTGEVVTAVDIAGGSGPQALVPSGWVAVPIDEAVPSGASIGDRVMIAADGVGLGRGVVVVAGDAPLVAVPEDDAAMVAAASANGSVMLLVEP